jgi:hypothetical protein
MSKSSGEDNARGRDLRRLRISFDCFRGDGRGVGGEHGGEHGGGVSFFEMSANMANMTMEHIAPPTPYHRHVKPLIMPMSRPNNTLKLQTNISRM